MKIDRQFMLRKIAVPLLCLLLGAAAGFALRGWLTGGNGDRTLVEVREGGYRFINPLLECDVNGDGVQNRELRPFRDKVEAFLRRSERARGANVSVYFREMNNGIWFLINGGERFNPASLRKVPMMIAALKQAERTPGFLNRKVRFDMSTDYTIGQSIRPSALLSPGHAYTLGDLVRRMIVYSDNNAFMLLSDSIDSRELERTYEQLNLHSARAGEQEDFLSIETYASFFRILYNASYLSKESSDLAMSALEQSEYRNGLVAGVPPDVPVAHKFGEHRDVPTEVTQLHDCGIVYYPHDPYLLCVMTRGQSFADLTSTIAGISETVFSEVDAQHRDGR